MSNTSNARSSHGWDSLVMRTLIGAACVALACLASPAFAEDFYVAVDGSSLAAGTLEDPWDIWKLDGSNAAGAGDTIHMRGGVYVYPVRDDGEMGFKIKVSGSSSAPVTIQTYDGERVVIDGGLELSDGNPAYVTLKGLEITVSENSTSDTLNDRRSAQSGSHSTDMDRPTGGLTFGGSGYALKAINCWIHSNTGSGLSMWKNCRAGTEAYGNIVTDNGRGGPIGDRNHGHGLYTQNSSGDVRYLRKNIFVDNWSGSMHVYTATNSPLNDYEATENIASNWYEQYADPLWTGGNHGTLVGGEFEPGAITVPYHKDIRDEELADLGRLRL